MTNTTEAQDELFTAVSFLTTGIVEVAPNAIRDAIAKGADPNAVDEEGRTPLTVAISDGMGSQLAVKELLEGGADPNLKDQQGWTPWTACLPRLGDSFVADIQKQIQQLLIDHNASREGEDEVLLWHYAGENNLDEVRNLLAKGVGPDTKLLCPLGIAVIEENTEMVKLLLSNGANPEGNNPEGLTPLMHAASHGCMDIVKLLVDAGADVDYEMPDVGIKAEFYAEEGGYKDILTFLQSHTKKEREEQKDYGKFNIVRDKQTNGTNCDISNEDIIAKLQSWDATYGIDISDVEFANVIVTFKTLPDDMRALAEEIYEFCPDTIDQGYGCMDEMVEHMEEMGQELDPEVAKLIEGVDFEDENFGLVLLEKDVKNKKQVSLWWD